MTPRRANGVVLRPRPGYPPPQPMPCRRCGRPIVGRVADPRDALCGPCERIVGAKTVQDRERPGIGTDSREAAEAEP